MIFFKLLFNIFNNFLSYLKMETIEKYKIIHSLIDIAGYFGGNYAVHKLADTPKPKMTDTAIFGISDIIVRNSNIFDPLTSKMPFSEKTKNNESIALVSFLLNTVYDVAMKDKSLSKNIIDNAIKNGISLLTNMGIDKVIPPEYN